MTVNEIMQNYSINPDRFGMAAISYIFKAFGDNIRSKEYWPWGKDVQCKWTEPKGANDDLATAIKLIECAKERIELDTIDTTKPIGTKSLKERLETNIRKSNNADSISDKINKTSQEYNERINHIENYI